MIHPIPQGVHPNTHRCGCGGVLLMPWQESRQSHALVCMTNMNHDTYVRKYTGTKVVGLGAEVYIKDGKPVRTRWGTVTMRIRDKDLAFENALRVGALSQIQSSPGRWVGDYMYMYTLEATDAFKHSDTRKYIFVRIRDA